MGNSYTNINKFRGEHPAQQPVEATAQYPVEATAPNSSHNPLIMNNEFYNAVYAVNPTAANDFATGITYILNGLQNLGVSREDAEDAIYYLEDYISQGVFGQYSYTTMYGATYYGPQSTNFNPNTYSSMATNWTPYNNEVNIIRADT
jgi:hypothetical protein